MKKILFSLLFVFFCVFSTATDKNWGVYFTDPQGGRGKTITTPEGALKGLIKNCTESFYGAFYDISAEEIAQALVDAFKRGVDVKLVIDDDNFSGKCITMLLDAGVPLVTDNRSALMHNKFAIIDRNSVFTGSYNTTDNCAHKNNNNSVLFRSTALAEIFINEFDEMFSGGIFGNKSERGPFALLKKTSYASVDGMELNAYFAPEDDVEKIIFRHIKDARKSVYFMYFSFTSDDLGELMIEKYKSGVKVAGIFEKRGANSEYSEYTKMKIEGLPVQLDSNRDIMHHKVLVIDGVKVITGSYNLSRNANNQNDENIIIINSVEIAALFIEEFNRLYPGSIKWE